MGVTVFKTTFANNLRSAVPANIAKYGLDEPFANAIGVPSAREIPTNLVLEGPLELDLPDTTNLKDFENAMRIHKAFRQLRPLQARDPRLWTHLTHVELWSYMRARWPVERHTENEQKAARFVQARYFIPQSQGRALLRNGIARLWWTAHLSYDETRNNPYDLLAVLLSTLDITQQILERGMGRAPSVVGGFLEFLSRNRDPLLDGGNANRARIRKLAKFLNLYGGVCLIDYKSQAEIIGLLNREWERILSSERQPQET